MKLIKQSRQGKDRHKKKKHHHHKNKDRSRSRSAEAKFSSDSQKLPNYIQDQYNKDEIKPNIKMDPINLRTNQSPLRYDPQEEELTKRESYIPKGSIIKIKSCEAEMVTRKRGKV